MDSQSRGAAGGFPTSQQLADEADLDHLAGSSFLFLALSL
jgi:hypothetical protein